jgi:TPP-dependent indolepyruvate ferredoxin oxidoreductase alpha subunit
MSKPKKPSNRALAREIRARMKRTGEPYNIAKRRVSEIEATAASTGAPRRRSNSTAPFMPNEALLQAIDALQNSPVMAATRQAAAWQTQMAGAFRAIDALQNSPVMAATRQMAAWPGQMAAWQGQMAGVFRAVDALQNSPVMAATRQMAAWQGQMAAWQGQMAGVFRAVDALQNSPAMAATRQMAAQAALLADRPALGSSVDERSDEDAL